MDDEKLGWEIDGRFYCHLGRGGLRHGDYALIREVTGFGLDEFDRGHDSIALETGWLAVAVWQGNPELRRDQVRDFVEKLPVDGAKRVGWEKSQATEEEPDVVPPAGAPSGAMSSTSAAPPAATEKTTDEAEQTLESSTRNGSGSPPSATGHISPLVTS